MLNLSVFDFGVTYLLAPGPILSPSIFAIATGVDSCHYCKTLF